MALQVGGGVREPEQDRGGDGDHDPGAAAVVGREPVVGQGGAGQVDEGVEAVRVEVLDGAVAGAVEVAVVAGGGSGGGLGGLAQGGERGVQDLDVLGRAEDLHRRQAVVEGAGRADAALVAGDLVLEHSGGGAVGVDLAAHGAVELLVGELPGAGQDGGLDRHCEVVVVVAQAGGDQPGRGLGDLPAGQCPAGGREAAAGGELGGGVDALDGGVGGQPDRGAQGPVAGGLGEGVPFLGSGGGGVAVPGGSGGGAQGGAQLVAAGGQPSVLPLPGPGGLQQLGLGECGEVEAGQLHPEPGPGREVGQGVHQVRLGPEGQDIAQRHAGPVVPDRLKCEHMFYSIGDSLQGKGLRQIGAYNFASTGMTASNRTSQRLAS